MSTIDDAKLIRELIANDGHYSDDPRVAQIVEYTNRYGKVTWGVTWSNELPDRQVRYEKATIYVINPRVIWKATR